MLCCVVCGSPYAETDAHCPGGQCGADLRGQRSGDPSYAVQAWCEPREVTAEPGETVLVTLTLRNAGSAMDRYEPDIAPDAGQRTALDRSGPIDVFSGEQRGWTIVYTLSSQAGAGAGRGPGSDAGGPGGGGAFGLGGMDSGGGSAFEDAAEPAPERIDVPIRVVSTTDSRVAACAVFSIRLGAALPGDQVAGASGHGSAVELYHPADSRRAGGKNRRLRIAAVATAVAIVAAVLVGLAVAGPGDDQAPGPQNLAHSGGPVASGAAPDAASAPAGSPSAAVTATPSTSSSPATPSPSAGVTVTVPDVVGMSQAQGLAVLREKGLRPTVVGTGDRIASTDPAPGRKVDRAKTAVTVTLSAPTGSPPPPSSAPPNPPQGKLSVPGVAAMTYAQAEARLTAQGFPVTRADEISTSAAGTALRTSPAEGTMVAPGTTVTVTVAKADDAMTVVPRLDNLYLPDAIATVRAAGLSFDAPYDVSREYQRRCRLAEFTPGEGTPLRKGSTIKVLRVVGCG